ncbi:adenosine receptor A2a isoform X1 [Manis pentadactyla]|uniref:adenosine receptor A2a isoform X1 n=1 Tax=Manis pentadactyla TaxID=143292 RepID=UPI00255CEE6A|nr:adenosine receptor A2a isoform X1 [Manis pentadactyla]
MLRRQGFTPPDWGATDTFEEERALGTSWVTDRQWGGDGTEALTQPGSSKRPREAGASLGSPCEGVWAGGPEGFAGPGGCRPAPHRRGGRVAPEVGAGRDGSRESSLGGFPSRPRPPEGLAGPPGAQGPPLPPAPCPLRASVSRRGGAGGDSAVPEAACRGRPWAPRPKPEPKRRRDSGSRRASGRYNGLVTGTRAKGIIGVCWVLSFAIGLTPMLGWNSCGWPSAGGNRSQGCGAGQVACLFEDVVPMNYMVYYNFFACVLGPLLLMLGVYLRIFLAARRQLKQMESQPLPGARAQSTLQKEVHAAKSLAIIVGLFALCWLPLHIINCFTFFCPACSHAPAWLMYLTIVLSHTNSVVNPLIYAYRIREFRQTFRKIIRSHILRRREPLKAGGTSARASAAHGSDAEQVGLRLNGHPPGVWANGSAPHPERRPNGYALGFVSRASAPESHGDVELLSHKLKGAGPERPGLRGPQAPAGAGVS